MMSEPDLAEMSDIDLLKFQLECLAAQIMATQDSVRQLINLPEWHFEDANQAVERWNACIEEWKRRSETKQPAETG